MGKREGALVGFDALKQPRLIPYFDVELLGFLKLRAGIGARNKQICVFGDGGGELRHRHERQPSGTLLPDATCCARDIEIC